MVKLSTANISVGGSTQPGQNLLIVLLRKSVTELRLWPAIIARRWDSRLDDSAELDAHLLDFVLLCFMKVDRNAPFGFAARHTVP